MNPSNNVDPFWTQRRRTIAMAAILLISAALRLYNLRSSPAWYHDECIYVQQIWNLMHGVFAWDNIAHSYLPRLPFMHLLVMPFFSLFGKDVVWIRLVAAFSGIGTTWLIYRIARNTTGRSQAILAAAIFAALPYAVLINRWGFSYNLDCFLGAANLYFLQRFQKGPGRAKYLFLAAASAGLGVVVDPVMVGRLVLLTAIILIFSRSFKGVAALLMAGLPLVLYVGLMLLFQRDIFLQDARIILDERVMESSPALLIGSFWEYMTDNGPWLALGGVGLFLLPMNRSSRILLWSFVFDLFFLLKSTGPDSSILFRTGIILAPQLSVGMGIGFVAAWRQLCRMAADQMRAITHHSKPALALAAKTIAACIIALSLVGTSIGGITGNFRFNYNEACIFSIADADALAAWANQRLKSDDLVISTHINWMLNCQTTSPMVVDLIRNGQQSPIYPNEFKDRALRELDLNKARWVITHEAYPGMLKHYHFNKTYQEIIDSWDQIHMQGLFRVFENPAY